MPYRIQSFNTTSGQFVNTTHEAPDIRALKRLAEGDAFRGVRVRIVNDSGQVIFEPSVREAKPDEAKPDPSLAELAAMLNVPIVDSPEKLFGGPGGKKH